MFSKEDELAIRKIIHETRAKIEHLMRRIERLENEIDKLIARNNYTGDKSENSTENQKRENRREKQNPGD